MTCWRLRLASTGTITALLFLGSVTRGGTRTSFSSVSGVGVEGVPRDEAAASGGETTVFDEGPTAFGRVLANLQSYRWDDIRAGKERFQRQWPQAGPWADATSCAACHAHDGRGPRSGGNQQDLSHLLRLTQPDGEGDPVYGTQLRRAGYGVAAPGRFTIEWQEVRGRYASGEAYAVRRPTVRLHDLAYGPLDSKTKLSLRVPPAVFGLGLLETVSEAEILAVVDPADADANGISGRAAWVRDPSAIGPRLGRFGWKASHPTLATQSGAALAVDIGVMNPLMPARSAGPGTHEADPEVAGTDLDSLVRYLRAIAPPGRRRFADPVVRRGEALFAEIGCDACHRPQLTTAQLAGWPELSFQTIRPYSDLLLHDMGLSLTDDAGEGAAAAAEWRTAPLWGVGLLPVVCEGAGLMHDGRARSPEEAVLWHGGEAAAAAARFKTLPLTERQALLTFVGTL